MDDLRCPKCKGPITRWDWHPSGEDCHWECDNLSCDWSTDATTDRRCAAILQAALQRIDEIADSHKAGNGIGEIVGIAREALKRVQELEEADE